MSKSKDKDKDKDKQQREAPADADPKQSGRVAFDSRGNPTWEWQTSTGVFGRDVSTQRLKKLEAKELSLMDTQKVKKPEKLALEDAPQPGGGFNPYNSSGQPSTPPRKPSSSTPGKPADKTGDEWWTKKKPKR